ncbi:MAG: hypothetical protein Unbinned6284contig1004_51 [Prokaryotic dsDNA virus sp.]|nr:MAG: hypothetical protein Unbinned6284contig1004_51 [Prokaryotic dsDNA virus sp.]
MNFKLRTIIKDIILNDDIDFDLLKVNNNIAIFKKDGLSLFGLYIEKDEVKHQVFDKDSINIYFLYNKLENVNRIKKTKE